MMEARKGHKIEFLGTGEAVTIPQCRVCVEARAKGIPYGRSGPSCLCTVRTS
ncbi:hypothetical protein B4119_2122 [Parageobacillus caldoxylosilyticus]|uniref:Uncharacterized protein n=1 Tax=Saccharococcus caldoxylosilyticus TaxID=81408 RepID=A0A150LYN5_9BACL|nr:hypothetical protein B4119_2122 [Parageobacillus caldoxylosilyticus]